jgi:2'-5' RNA ligase
VRIFVALPLPQVCAEKLEEQTFSLRELNPRWRWVPEDNLHVTLIFLGEVDRRGAELVIRATAEAAHDEPPLELSAGELITLPYGSNARVLALRLEDAGKRLAAFVRKLEYALETAARAENSRVKQSRDLSKRAFKPHITLARKGPAPLTLPEFDQMITMSAFFDCVTVYQSTLLPEGAAYTPLEVFKLKENAP